MFDRVIHVTRYINTVNVIVVCLSTEVVHYYQSSSEIELLLLSELLYSLIRIIPLHHFRLDQRNILIEECWNNVLYSTLVKNQDFTYLILFKMSVDILWSQCCRHAIVGCTKNLWEDQFLTINHMCCKGISMWVNIIRMELTVWSYIKRWSLEEEWSVWMKLEWLKKR